MAGKKHKLISLIAAFAVMTAAVPAQYYTAFDVEENSRQQEELAEENSQLSEKISDTERTIEEKQEYSKELQKQISELSTKIQKSNQTIKTLNTQIVEKQKQIEEKLEQIQDRLNLLRARIKAIYVAGDTSSLEIILQAKDFSDFLDKAELVQSISDYDTKLINSLQSEMEGISLEQKSLRNSKTQVENEKRSLEANKKKINELSEENSRLIEELRDEKQSAEEALKANEAQQNELQKALEEYNKALAEEAERQKALEEARAKAKAEAQAQAKERATAQARARAAAQAREKALAAAKAVASGQDPTTSVTDDDLIDQIVIPEGDEWVWPCPGHTYLTSTFDEWRGENNHGALDIADGSVYGAQVVACWEGTVFSINTDCPHDYGKDSSCGCGGGYGNYVMIDHGDGRISIYGHLSGVTVEVGQTVVGGQLIGYVGSTGYSTGPHLHFETRFDGVRYDPLSEY